jgi:FKBP-type peptidyl-prolyl cis-trans isomerase
MKIFRKRISVFSIVLVLLHSCSAQESLKKTEKGLRYIFHKDVPGPTAKLNDIITFHVKIFNSDDSLILDSYSSGLPQKSKVTPPLFDGSFEEGWLLMSKGDSVTMFVQSDSIFYGVPLEQRPPMFKPRSLIRFVFKLENIQSEEEFKKEQEQLAAKLKNDQQVEIQKYLATHKLKSVIFDDGIHYIQKKTSKTGIKPSKGDTVSVHYTGKFLNGKVFDSSLQRGTPIEFPLGIGFVIQGWDKGIANMAEGESGTLIIPSHLGYGAQDNGPIPANSILVFDVELIKVKKSKKAPNKK